MFVWNSDIRERNRMDRCLSKNSHYYIEELHLEILHRARMVVRTSTQTFSLFDPESSAQRLRHVLYACFRLHVFPIFTFSVPLPLSCEKALLLSWLLLHLTWSECFHPHKGKNIANYTYTWLYVQYMYMKFSFTNSSLFLNTLRCAIELC